MEQQTFFKIEGKILLATLQYLDTKPHGEVSRLISVLQRLEQVKESKEEVPCPEKIEKKLKNEAKEAKIQ